MADPRVPPKGVTDLRPQRHAGAQPPLSREVFIDPRVDPAAAAYQAGMAARAAQRGGRGLPKYMQQVGGEPAPSIPLLSAEAEEGATMAEQAFRVNQPSQQQLMSMMGQDAQQAMMRNPGSIVEPPTAAPSVQTARQMEQAIVRSIQPGDMLPPDAQRDPAFMQGGGALFAANQPHLVLKYGLVRNGQLIPPQELARVQRTTPGTLSAQSVEGLQALIEHQKKPPAGMPKTEEEADAQAATSAAAQSGRVGSPIKRLEKSLTPEEEKKIQEAVEKLDSFDYSALQKQIEEDALRNPQQREIIEARLEPLDMDQLITHNRVTQDVTIHPGKNGKGKLWYTYESMTGGEDLVLKQLIMKESKAIEVTDQYLLDKYAFMSIAVGLKAINGNPLPRHTDDHGKFDEKAFWIKFAWVLERPLHLLASIGINHVWFENRVRRMFVAEKLGNG